jgi:putative aldouronate transport system substrate-binding protein
MKKANRNWKRKAAVLMSAAMMASMGTGFTAAADEAAPEEKVTIRIGMQQDGNIIDFDENYMTKRIEEACNVELELVALPADTSEYKQKISLMVSGGGEELPDILCGWGISDNDAALFGNSGVFIPLNDYYTDETKSPNIHKNIPAETLEYMLNSVTSMDGNIYSVPQYTPEIGNEYARRAWINVDWLEKLNLEMPTTTDEFYEVLKAFKEQDPNGNGKKDEIPMMGCLPGWNVEPQNFLMNAFVYTDADKNYFYVKEGKITPAFVSEEWKQGLEYMNKLVSEDLLSPLSFTQDTNQLKTILENEDAQLLGCLSAGTLSLYTPDSKRVGDMDVLPPLTGPNGACYATYNKTVPTPMFFITSNCKNPDRAFQIADYMFDEEMKMVMRFGEEGVNWTKDFGDWKSPYEDTLDVKTGFRELDTAWGIPQNSHWNGANPTYRGEMDSLSMQGMAIDPETATGVKIKTPEALPYYMDKHPEEIITRYVYTEEEQAEAADLSTSINTFVKESMVRFIVGEMPISEWETYLDTLNSMGLERYIEILQAAYDRAEGK